MAEGCFPEVGHQLENAWGTEMAGNSLLASGIRGDWAMYKQQVFRFPVCRFPVWSEVGQCCYKCWAQLADNRGCALLGGGSNLKFHFSTSLQDSQQWSLPHSDADWRGTLGRMSVRRGGKNGAFTLSKNVLNKCRAQNKIPQF